jgi:class 3 adenylate cyclase
MSGCDWSGAAVNLAARLSAEAEPNQALGSAATGVAAGAALEQSLGPRRELVLRGIARPVAAWRLA